VQDGASITIYQHRFSIRYWFSQVSMWLNLSYFMLYVRGLQLLLIVVGFQELSKQLNGAFNIFLKYVDLWVAYFV
jgi:uncharacterized membrane protein